MGGAAEASGRGHGHAFEWRGPEPPPHPGKALGRLLLDGLRRHAASTTKAAQIDGTTGTAKTYAELHREAVLAAAGWRTLGIGASDTIAIFSTNNHHTMTALLGGALEGITLATMTPNSTKDELRRLASLVTIRAMVCEPTNLQVALEVLPKGALLVLAAEAVPAGVDALAVPELVRRGSAAGVDVDTYEARDVGDLREHVACVVFSSGTTGMPKGVMETNYGLVINLISDRWAIVPDDVALVTSGVSWITGIGFTFTTILRGATRVIANFTTDDECLNLVRKYKVSHTFLAPGRYFQLAGVIRSLRAAGEHPDLSHWRVPMTGGAAMTADMQRSCSEALGAAIVQGYGSTELVLVAADACPPTYGSVGRLSAGVRARLIDVATGRDISSPDTVGELRLWSASSMKGYAGDPKMTAKALDERGYFCTGDLAKFDEDGKLFIVDRIKELLKFMNIQVTPVELEDLLMHHPAVKSACVVGRPHPVVGDIPTAFVVLFAGMEATAEELQDLVKGSLSKDKHLRGGVFFVDEIPVCSNGKYDRKALRERLNKQPPISDEVLGLCTAHPRLADPLSSLALPCV